MIALVAAVLASFAAEPSTPRDVTWPAPAGPSSGTTGDETLAERCDGSRSPTPGESTVRCTRWKIEWTIAGKVWGVSSAASLQALITERERLLGYARLYARLFEKPIDVRWAQPSAPICDLCDASGIAGELRGLPISAVEQASRQEWLDARLKLAQFESTVLEHHAARLRDIARLTRDAAAARLAKAYAKQLELAVIECVQVQHQLDNAAVFRDRITTARLQKTIATRTQTLDAAATALGIAIAKTVARQHAGRYVDDAVTTAEAGQLVIAFAGERVTATLVVGDAQSNWFEGKVELDGSIIGRSLVAPEHAQLRCDAHSIECGFVWAPAALRFADRDDARGKRHVVELWFQQAEWRHSKPFSR